MPLTRRQALRNGLKFAGAVPLVIAGGRSHAGGTPFYGDVPALKDIAAARGLKIGNAIHGTRHWDNLKLVKRHCSMITPEVHWKPSRINSEGESDFASADAYRDFALRNNLSVHGHTLFWHRSKLPSNHNQSADDLFRAYGAHVETMVNRYKDVTESWDVANEIISNQYKMKSADLRQDEHLSMGGLDFVDFLFRTARKADSRASLYLNDYSLCFRTELAREKRARFLKIIRELRAKGTPLDGIGIQAHLNAKYGFDGPEVGKFIGELERLGLGVHISELDVNDISLPANRRQRDEIVASIYGEALNTFLKFGNVKMITFWGFADRYNHITRGNAYEIRKDGDSRPALFDMKSRPKKSYWAVVKALESRKA
jgi:endo-1,4-beta-xylanase